MRLMALAAAAAVTAMAPAQAQSSKEVDELRQELQKLRQEVAELKKSGSVAKPADASGWGERIEQLEIKQKDAVVAGDIAGGFRLPGSETSVHLYGYAEAHAIHDFGSWGSPDNFSNLAGQPLKADNPQKGRTKFTAETSRFGIETSTPTSHGTFNTKIETDFYSYGSGNRNRLRLRHAYGEYAGWLIGQTWSTFMDLDNTTETVDFNAQLGVPFSRRTQIRYTWGDAKEGYKFTFAAEDPEDQFGGGSANERFPHLVARFDKTFDWGGINIRALTHEKRDASGVNKRGWGIGAGGNYKLTDKDLLMVTVASVNGDFDNMVGSNGYFFDGSKFLFDRNLGIALGWNRTFSDQLRSNVSYEESRAHMSDEMVNGLAALTDSAGNPTPVFANRRLQQLHAGFIYSPIKNVELGAEYVWGRRTTYLNGAGLMSRVDLMGRYSF
jgi:hypothetical protein